MNANMEAIKQIEIKRAEIRRRMRNRKRTISVPIALFLAGVTCLSGCAKSVPPPKYRLNPSPEEQYLMTVYSNHDLPQIRFVGPGYQIANENCVPVNYGRALGGVKLSYPTYLNLRPIQISKKRFEVLVSKDSILPEDYWGLGVCKWKFIGVSLTLEIGGTRDSIGFFGEDFRDGAKATWKCVEFNSGRRSRLQCTRIKDIGSWHDEANDPTKSKMLVRQTFWMNLRRVRK